MPDGGIPAGGSIVSRWVIAAGTAVPPSGMSSHVTPTDDGGSWAVGVFGDAVSDVAALSESPLRRISVAPESALCTSSEPRVTAAGTTFVSISS